MIFSRWYGLPEVPRAFPHESSVETKPKDGKRQAVCTTLSGEHSKEGSHQGNSWDLFIRRIISLVECSVQAGLAEYGQIS